MRCFKGKERTLLQQHEITTSEKVFIFHGNFIQGIHVVEIDQPALSKWRFTFHEGLFLYYEHQV